MLPFFRKLGHATCRMTIPHEKASNRSGLSFAQPKPPNKPPKLPLRYFSGGPYTGSNTVSSSE